MSAQEFKPGDKIRVIKAAGSDGHLILGEEHVVGRVMGGDVSWEGGWRWSAERFEHAEPEDAPAESIRRIIHLDREDFPACGAGEQMRKVGEPGHTTATKRYFLEWHLGVRSEPGADVCADCALIATEPEDADDVEPEPLKAGDRVLVWAEVSDPKPDYDGDITLSVRRVGKSTGDARSDVWANPDAIVRPSAGQVPPWVKPAQCTSLYDSGAGNSLMRCEHEAGHETKHVVGWVAWTDAEAYGRVEVSS